VNQGETHGRRMRETTQLTWGERMRRQRDGQEVMHGSFSLCGCMQGSSINVTDAKDERTNGMEAGVSCSVEGTRVRREGETNQVFRTACNEWELNTKMRSMA
jgi:hypothetical protein